MGTKKQVQINDQVQPDDLSKGVMNAFGFGGQYNQQAKQNVIIAKNEMLRKKNANLRVSQTITSDQRKQTRDKEQANQFKQDIDEYLSPQIDIEKTMSRLKTCYKTPKGPKRDSNYEMLQRSMIGNNKIYE